MGETQIKEIVDGLIGRHISRETAIDQLTQMSLYGVGKFRERRKRLKVSMFHVSRATGISHSTIGRIETGEGRFNYECAVKLHEWYEEQEAINQNKKQ